MYLLISVYLFKIYIMKPFIYIAGGLLLLLSIGCKKEKSPLLKALDESTFDCVERESYYFFEGTLNGEKVCYHVGYDDYEMILRKSTGFSSGTLLDPTNPSGTTRTWGTFSIEPAAWEHLSQSFQIETPKFLNSDIGKDSILKATVIMGDLPLANETDVDNSFNLKIMIFSKNGFEDSDGGQTISLQTGGGKQKDSFLKVTELETTEVGAKRFYSITFEFACDLYTAGDGDIKYGRLEDGKMRISVVVDK